MATLVSSVVNDLLGVICYILFTDYKDERQEGEVSYFDWSPRFQF